MQKTENKTRENLQAAFAGESMANRKYLYFAKVARKLGNEEVAKLFEETAHQETGHALSHLELLYPPGELTVEKILELSIEGELHETNEMYPAFERVALAEGREAAAKRFKALGLVEKYHANRYIKALEKINQAK